MPGWIQAAAELNERIPFARIAFDEGHLATIAKYRKSLNNVDEIRPWPMQLLVMSGSVSNTSEQELGDDFGLSASRVVIRTNTVRPELQYILKQPKGKVGILNRVEDILKVERAKHQPRDRVLIFVRFEDQGDILADKIKCPFYKGKLTDMERDKCYQAWVSGRKPIMIATAAFGAGNDYSHVRTVIHAGTPANAVDYVQESSRAGRDGQPAKCFILPMFGSTALKPKAGEEDHSGFAVMHELATKYWTPTCIRFGLTGFFDVTGTMCGETISYQKCRKCLNPPKPLPKPAVPFKAALAAAARTAAAAPPPQETTMTKRKAPTADQQATFERNQRRKMDRNADKELYIDKLKEALDYYEPFCVFCDIMGNTMEDRHDIFRCETFLSFTDRSAYTTWRDGLGYKENTMEQMCYVCHVPQMNDRMHGTFTGRPKDCQYKDILVPVAYSVYHRGGQKALMEEHYDTKWPTLEIFREWMNKAPSGGDLSHLSGFFLTYHKKFNQR